MWTALIVLLSGAVLIGAAAFWVLRAYREAGGGRRSARGALVACAGVGILGLMAYLAIGNPELAGGSYADRLEALKGRDPTTWAPDEALAVLSEAARANPEDPLPHFYSGQVLMVLQRPQDAARSYDAALRRDPRFVDALMGLGRAMVEMEGFTPEALAVFQQAAELTEDPAPLIWQAMAAMEQNREADGRRLWREALARMGPDDPRREMARRFASGQGP